MDHDGGGVRQLRLAKTACRWYASCVLAARARVPVNRHCRLLVQHHRRVVLVPREIVPVVPAVAAGRVLAWPLLDSRGRRSQRGMFATLDCVALGGVMRPATLWRAKALRLSAGGPWREAAGAVLATRLGVESRRDVLGCLDGIGWREWQLDRLVYRDPPRAKGSTR